MRYWSTSICSNRGCPVPTPQLQHGEGVSEWLIEWERYSGRLAAWECLFLSTLLPYRCLIQFEWRCVVCVWTRRHDAWWLVTDYNKMFEPIPFDDNLTARDVLQALLALCNIAGLRDRQWRHWNRSAYVLKLSLISYLTHVLLQSLYRSNVTKIVCSLPGGQNWSWSPWGDCTSFMIIPLLWAEVSERFWRTSKD